jgi:LEA14-like dessication related protein
MLLPWLLFTAIVTKNKSNGILIDGGQIMKKIPQKIIGCIAAFSAALVLSTCQSLEAAFREPVLSLQSVQLAKISFTGAELLCKVNVENPNRIDIPLPEIGWEFFIGANSFVKGTIKSNGSIKSRKTTVVNLPVSVNYIEMFDSVASLVGSKAVDYKVALDARIPRVPYLERKVWHFERQGNFPVLRAPIVNFRGIELKNNLNLNNPSSLLSLTKLDFELGLEIENNNSVPMAVNKLSYNFAVNNSQWSNGGVQNLPRLAAGEKAVIPIPFSLSSLNMINDIIRIITNNSDVAYAFTGDFGLGIADLPVLSDLGTSVNFGGNTKVKR